MGVYARYFTTENLWFSSDTCQHPKNHTTSVLSAGIHRWQQNVNKKRQQYFFFLKCVQFAPRILGGTWHFSKFPPQFILDSKGFGGHARQVFFSFLSFVFTFCCQLGISANSRWVTCCQGSSRCWLINNQLFTGC